ncbi:molecular chaperone DnaJ [Halobacteriales archaeon SW_5_68_122]|nr:MAG: molecular chaperone DnaJ [Halobacteriales archaeon SW_5_68_122]
MQKDRLVFALTLVFAAMTGLVILVAVAAVEPVLFVLAVPLGAATAVFWYQSSGKLRERVRRTQQAGGRRRESRGGFGAGARRETRRDRQRARNGGRRRPWGQTVSDLSPAEAYRRLDLENGADESEVRRAYRRKVKEVHPDRGGDEEAFKRVTEAYETLLE